MEEFMRIQEENNTELHENPFMTTTGTKRRQAAVRQNRSDGANLVDLEDR